MPRKSSTDNIVFCSAGEDEVPALYQRGLSSFQNPAGAEWGWTEDYLRDLLSSSSGFHHIAEIPLQPQILGLHCGVWNYPESSRDQCRIYWIYVDDEFRRRGIANRLIQCSLARAAERGKRSVMMGMGVLGSDDAMRCIAEPFGFQQVETVKLMYLPLDDRTRHVKNEPLAGATPPTLRPNLARD